MEITIKIDRRGMLSGSAADVSSKLENAKVYQKGSCIYVEYVKWKTKEGKEVVHKNAVCGIINNINVLQSAREVNKHIWKSYAYDPDLGYGFEKYVLFDYVLTEAGKAIAEDFIDKCVYELQKLFDEE